MTRDDGDRGDLLTPRSLRRVAAQLILNPSTSFRLKEVCLQQYQRRKPGPGKTRPCCAIIARSSGKGIPVCRGKPVLGAVSVPLPDLPVSSAADFQSSRM